MLFLRHVAKYRTANYSSSMIDPYLIFTVITQEKIGYNVNVCVSCDALGTKRLFRHIQTYFDYLSGFVKIIPLISLQLTINVRKIS